MEQASITFAYAEKYNVAHDQVVITDEQGRMVQLTLDQAVKMTEWIALNTKQTTQHSLVSGVPFRPYAL